MCIVEKQKACTKIQTYQGDGLSAKTSSRKHIVYCSLIFAENEP